METSALRQLGTRRPPGALEEARLTLHYAAQLPASFGVTLVEPRADDSHVSLSLETNVMFASESHSGVSLGLDPRTLELSLRRERVVLARVGLCGATFPAVTEWLESRLAHALGRAVTLLAPDHQMPAHEVEAGAPFHCDPEAFGELSDWFESAAGALASMTERFPEATPVRLWPHHFDLAMLIVLDRDESQAVTRSIGVGLSPGDTGISEPYWYVTPWPAPNRDSLPPLSGPGRWNVDGWFGAVLAGSALVSFDPSSRAAILEAFLTQATSRALEWLETAR